MPTLSVIVFALALCGSLVGQAGPRTRRIFLASFLGLLLSLIAQSTPRIVGDGREYVLMAVNLAQFERPSVTPDQMNQISTLVPGETADGMTQPLLRGPDGRQDFPHFWFYSLLAAPFVGALPLSAFTTLNVLLLLALAALLLKRVTPAVAMLVVAGPILWWVDKAHTEVLTLTLLTIALVEMPVAPWWSIVCLAFGALQNPLLAGAMIVMIAFAFIRHGWRDRRIWLATAAGTAIALVHPAYYYSRLRLWSGLSAGIDRHMPTWRELFTVPFDPNLGIFIHDPFVLAALLIPIAEVVTRPPARNDDGGESPMKRLSHSRWLGAAALGLMALLFLATFTQTSNFNSGATPGLSREGLLFIPFVVSIQAVVSRHPIWLKILAGASLLWCVYAFSPQLPSQHLRPSPLAAALWERWPGLDNPLAEVFAERMAGQEPTEPPVATANCEKVLLWGNGADTAWPKDCAPVQLPDFCQAKDALCYANRSGSSYDFVTARTAPGWRIGITRGHIVQRIEGILAFTQNADRPIKLTMTHEEGWSYPEYLSVPSPDVLSREWRWMEERAGVGVTVPEPVTVRLSIAARALDKRRRVRVSVGAAEVATLAIGTDLREHQTPVFTLPAGQTMVHLESLDGADFPAGDQRRLSVAVFRFELVREP